MLAICFSDEASTASFCLSEFISIFMDVFGVTEDQSAVEPLILQEKAKDTIPNSRMIFAPSWLEVPADISSSSPRRLAC
jgi:hypothetical protein